MLLTFGRSAFALPPISGVVLAAGSATARATVAASAVATKKGYGASTGGSSATSTALRTAFGQPQAVAAVAAVAATSKKLAAGWAVVAAASTPVATPACYLNAGGGSNAHAAPVATARRTLRPAFAGAIYVRALADAEAQTWALARALPAIARADVWGTTFQVGRGALAGIALASAPAGVRTAQAGGALSTAADATGESHRDASAVGLIRPNVVCIAGARHKKNGVGYHDAFGDAVVRGACASGEARVSPVLLVVARVVAQGAAEVLFAARGSSSARAVTAAGEANLLPTTQVGGAVIASGAIGYAVTTAYAKGRGACTVHAGAAAGAARYAAGGGLLLSIAVDAASGVLYKLGAGQVAPATSVTADALRRVYGAGVLALGAALTDAGVQINPLSPSTFVIEVELGDTTVEAKVPDNFVTVDAIDVLVEAA